MRPDPRQAEACSAAGKNGYVEIRPALSIVIASVNGYRYIAQCLRSLADQHDRERAEVIVVEASENDTAARIAAQTTSVKVCCAEAKGLHAFVCPSA